MADDKLRAVSVKSLNLPVEAEASIQKIANKSKTGDLDTNEEFRLASNALENLERKLKTARAQMTNVPTENKLRALVRRDNQVYVYSMEGNSSERRTYLGAKQVGSKQAPEEVQLDLRGCSTFNPGHIQELVSIHDDVYILFSKSKANGIFGKVVRTENGKERIQFLQSTVNLRGIQTISFVKKDETIYIRGINAIIQMSALEDLSKITPQYKTTACKL